MMLEEVDLDNKRGRLFMVDTEFDKARADA